MARTTLSDLRNRRSIVLPNTEQFEWIAVDPAQRLQPGMIVARDNDVVICEEHPEDHQRLREMMERIAQECSYTWIVQPTSGEISLNRIKKLLLDTLYPHACRNPDCARKLHFNELLTAADNIKIEVDFKKKIFDYLTEQYYEFDFVTRERWGHIIGKFEFRQYLRRLWKNKNVEFYCCSCAKKAEKGRILDDGRIHLDRCDNQVNP